MNNTSFVSIRPAGQDHSKWTVTTHTYDPVEYSDSRVKVVATGDLLNKNEATRSAVTRAIEMGRSFVRPDTGVLSLKVGQNAFGRTYQIIGLLQDGTVGTLGPVFKDSKPKSMLDNFSIDKRAMLQSMDLADSLATAIKKSFIPPVFIEHEAQLAGTPWKSTLNMARMVSNISSEEKEMYAELMGMLVGK